MQFSVGDKVVHPHRGPGRIVDEENTSFLNERKRYFVIELSMQDITMHIPAGRMTELDVRPAMHQAKIDRVLDILRSKPRRLPQDYKERQERVWEKIRAHRPIPTAEAVRDLTWRGESAHLTKRDSELLQQGQDFLAAEVALVSDSELSEASERIAAALQIAMAGMVERERHQQQPA